MEFVRVLSEGQEFYDEAVNIYANSFPWFEQRKPEAQIQILEQKDYHYMLIIDEDIFVGIMLFWETETFIYIEHFCISPQLRGHNYGKRALELVCRYAAGKNVILEIDPPEDTISQRRKQFYERGQFQENAFQHIHPPYCKEREGHQLVVMSYKEKLSGPEYVQFNDYLRNVVMKK